MRVLLDLGNEVVIVLPGGKEITVTSQGRVSAQAGVIGTEAVLTVAEAARFLGMGRSKLYQKISSGEIASVRDGGSRYLMRSTLEEYLRNRVEAARPGKK